MSRKLTSKTTLLNIGIVATMAGWLAVVMNRHAFDPFLYTVLLFVLISAATTLAWWHEALKERQLDELELAAASFGARWGVAVLGIMILLFLFVTPLQDAIVWFAEAYEDNGDRPLPAPVGVFIFGFFVAMILQMSAKSVLGTVWMWTKR